MAIRAGRDVEPIPGYKLVDRLGSGGYGEVWSCVAPGGLSKAIKLVYGQLPAPGDSKNTGIESNQVARELKGLSRVKDVRHPFVLSIERFDVVNGQLIIVMELAERDLQDRLRECHKEGLPGIPRAELLRYMSEAAEALDLMNSQYDIQHLDIKPSNLFVVGKHVKVADFGLAKAMEGVQASVTSGMTPLYAAPETFNGVATRFTDQYSLAIVYQELLTGTRPFPGPSTQQLMLQHLTKDPQMDSLSAEDRAVVGRALRKTPNERWSCCTEFVDQLKESGKIVQPAAPVPASNAPQANETPADYPGLSSDSRPATPVVPAQATVSSHSIRVMRGSDGPIIGIDLGTSNSVVAIMEGRDPKVLSNQEGSRLTPSVVAFKTDGERLIGAPAKRQASTNSQRTISSVKRFMGRRRCEVAEEERRMPYKIVGNSEEAARIQIGDKTFAPPEVSAMVLSKLKAAAEDYLGRPVSRAVITVPAYFNDSQRQATKDAGTIAGLEVMRIINEPTAASLAYGLERRKNEKIAVFDLGGGTFDITVMRIRDGIFDVLSTNGDTHLGGDDFDAELVELLASTFESETGLNPRTDPMALGRLREAAERAKHELSSCTQVDVSVPFLMADAAGPHHLHTGLSRSKFEQITEHLLERCRMPCVQALKDARLKAAEIDQVVLVGGSTRMPCVVEFVRDLFGKEPHRGVNPDEAIAAGAAIQGGILDGQFADLLLLDVTPLSLGVEAKGGLMSVLVERNTTVPTVVKKVFSTANDNQTEVGIHVVQGERTFARDNRTLGMFWLEGIRPGAAGAPQIEITFKIDANGILQVSARDLDAGTEQSISVQSSSGLSHDEIEEMAREAEQYAEADRMRREMQRQQNDANTTLRETERLLAQAVHITKEEKKTVQLAVDNLRRALSSNDSDEVGTALWQLQQVAAPLKLSKLKPHGLAAPRS